MRCYRVNIWMVLIFVGSSLNAQITFNACHSIIENQNYTFNLKSADATGRNVFETDPVTGDQDCGGIGVCEMQVAWNDTSSRWEVLADDGNGTFANTYVLYYNTEGSTPNPPSLILGTWIENTTITNSLCVDGITTFNGDVQDTTLGISDVNVNDGIVIYPNPVSSILNIRSRRGSITNLFLSDMNGRIVMSQFTDFETIDVSKLAKGVYFIKIESERLQLVKKLIIK